MKELPLPEDQDPDDKLFNHLDDVLVAIGDDALALVTILLEASRTFKRQALVALVLAILLTISMIPVFLGASVNYFSIVAYVVFLVATIWFAVRMLMLYASYSARCTRMLEASKKFREAKTTDAA
jgi:hypothetical protein